MDPEVIKQTVSELQQSSLKVILDQYYFPNFYFYFYWSKLIAFVHIFAALRDGLQEDGSRQPEPGESGLDQKRGPELSWSSCTPPYPPPLSHHYIQRKNLHLPRQCFPGVVRCGMDPSWGSVACCKFSCLWTWWLRGTVFSSIFFTWAGEEEKRFSVGHQKLLLWKFSRRHFACCDVIVLRPGLNFFLKTRVDHISLQILSRDIFLNCCLYSFQSDQ